MLNLDNIAYTFVGRIYCKINLVEKKNYLDITKKKILSRKTHNLANLDAKHNSYFIEVAI